MNESIGIVVIGRNDGERLQDCLSAIAPLTDNIIYVDSNSSDGSVRLAHSLGINVLQLDPRIPLSAGRARNEGFQYLTKNNPQVEFIQFIDGDCVLSKEWLAVACTFLENNPSCAIVAGKLRERFPDRSIYNYLCDIEWDTMGGEVKSCGGIFMVRKTIFESEEGFNPSVISGEEPELCSRIIRNGWKIIKTSHFMALHDAEMASFSQWWKRSIRSGLGFAQVNSLSARKSERYYGKEASRVFFWACILPISTILLATFVDHIWAMLSFTYPLQILRVAYSNKKKLGNWKNSFLFGLFVTVAKFPQLYGYIMFLLKKVTQKPVSIIE